MRFRRTVRLYFVNGEDPDDDRYLSRYEPGRGFDKSYRIAVPDFTGSYLSFDGQGLYLSQWYKHRILRLDPETGHVLRTIQIGAEICGHTFVDGQLYVLRRHGTGRGKLARGALRSAGRTTLRARWNLPTSPFACRSLAFDGERFWTNHRAANETVAFSLPDL